MPTHTENRLLTPSREVGLRVKIHWHVQNEHRVPFGRCSPDPAWFEPIGFPPPWPDRSVRAA